MAVVAYFNGQFVDPDGAWVPLEERGHQFGDGVYEVIRVYSGRPFLMEEHLERLERSLRVIDIANPHTSEEWAHLIAESVRRSGEAEAQIYLQVTRGSAVRGHVFPGEAAPNVSLVVRPAAAPVYPEDAALLALPDERWPNVYVKSINLLPNVIAKEAAKRAGAVEAMLVRAGVITEGASSNLWFVIGGRVYTHPANRYILGGITRQFVLQLARETGVEVVEEAVPFSKLGEVQEVFVTSTTQEILPVARVFTDRRIASALEALPAEPAETLLPQVQDPVELWRRPGDAVVTERLAEAFAQALEKFRNYEPLLQA
ncbi:aminotransferase class IV [Alicyclobacillus macrosporangiidus]|uniref:aminotransferase class IV n=1 Tax=Alicyclobacillus macrosporangiidus TaxID=392015 RepID=UPI0005509E1E|nr:aminotransferase class IV [Alicyclobacillus macrosporangiidus]